MIILKKLSGTDIVNFHDLKLSDYTVSEQLMDDRSIVGDLSTSETITEAEWLTECFAIYGGEEWYNYTIPVRFKDNTQIEKKYTLTLKPQQEILKDIDFLDVIANDPFRLTTGINNVQFIGNIQELYNRILGNLQYRSMAWTVTYETGLFSAQANNYKEVSLDGLKIWDALQAIRDIYGLKFAILGTTIHIYDTISSVSYTSPITGITTVKQLGNVVTKEFAYGKADGLYEITKSPTEDKIYALVRGVGSDKNIPYNYYRDSPRFALNPCPRYAPNLMPTIFTQGDGIIGAWVRDYYTDAEQIALGNTTEAFIRFDGTGDLPEIYPTIEGVTYGGLPIDVIKTVGDIGSDEINEVGKVKDATFEITLNPLGFNLSEAVSAKGEMTISMKSGLCAGSNFKVMGINGVRNDGLNAVQNIFIPPREIYSASEFIDGRETIFTITSFSRTAEQLTKLYLSSVNYGMVSSVIHSGIQEHSFTLTITPYFENRVDASIIPITGGGSYEFLPPVGGSDPNEAIAGQLFIPEQEVYDTLLGYFPSGVWDFKVKIEVSVSEPLSPLVDGSAFITADFRASVPYITDRGTIIQPDLSTQEITLTLQKSLDDFGVLMPNANLNLAAGDKFALLGVNLPDSYVIAAEQRLEDAILNWLSENNYGKFQYDAKIYPLLFAQDETIEPQIAIGYKIKLKELTEDLEIISTTIEKRTDMLLKQYNIQLSPTTKRTETRTTAINRQIAKILSTYGKTTKDLTVITRSLSTDIYEVATKAFGQSAPEAGSGGDMSAYVLKTGDTMTGTLIVKKVVPETLIVPKIAPVLEANQWAFFMSDTGFTGEPPSGGGGTIETLADIGDVTLVSLLANQFLRRNSTNTAWENVTLTKAMITDFAHNHDSEYLKLTGGVLTGALTATAYTEGATLLSDKYLYTNRSLFSPTLGVLVQTSIAANEDTAVEVVVRGSRWDGTSLLNLDINLYHTSSNISGLRAIGHGTIGTVYAFDYLGFLCIWFAATPSFSNLRIMTFASGSNRQDRTTSVNNSSLPSSGRTKDQTVSPSVIYTSLNSNRSDVAWAASAFTEGGVSLASKYLGISANAVSATKLLNARTIWGQSFDGTANVTGALSSVTDITASGTISMAENVNTRLTVPTSAPTGMTAGRWYFWIG
jgi:hypothetical protein